MSQVLTTDQLNQVKAGYVNGVINSLSISALANLAAAQLGRDLPSDNEAGLRDAIISQTNLETWNQLVDSLKAAETEAE